MSNSLLYERESYIIRGIAYDIYKQFRDGHKEKLYHNAFYLGLRDEDLKSEKNKRIPIYYKGKKVGVYIPDLVVEDKIMIELKAKEQFTKYDKDQFWYYLRNTDYDLGFLINFGAPDGVQIIRRIHTK